MTVKEYCFKVNALADKLECAGSLISKKDLLIQILNALGLESCLYNHCK